MERISEETRRRMIAEAAYFRAEQRGFENGDPTTDWIEAEREVDTELFAVDKLEGTHRERLIIANEWLKGMRKKLSHLAGETREEWESDIEKLARLRDNFRKQMKAMQEKSGIAAERAKDKAEATWAEIAATLEQLSKRKSRH